ncbi:M23 family metallopeptidase [Synechococcus sp. PCC 6716]|nr:M23 family metallopeptidase [Synechococcus sp. PCC 6716]
MGLRLVAIGLTAGLLAVGTGTSYAEPPLAVSEDSSPAPTLINPVEAVDSEPLVFSTEPVDPPAGSEPLENLRPARPLPVVLQERSTGCQATLHGAEELPASLCAPAIAPAAPATPATIASYPTHHSYPPLHSASHASQPRATTTTYVRQPFPGANPLRWLNFNNRQMLFPLPFAASITSTFGWRVHPIFGDRRFHSGTDLAAPEGTPVLAVFDGRVVESNRLGGYGLTVILRHPPDQHETLYAHLSQLFVNPGQWVKQGEVIGLVGSTGNSTGPHLHFEIHEMTAQGLIPVAPEARLALALQHLREAIAHARSQQNPS